MNMNSTTEAQFKRKQSVAAIIAAIEAGTRHLIEAASPEGLWDAIYGQIGCRIYCDEARAVPGVKVLWTSGNLNLDLNGHRHGAQRYDYVTAYLPFGEWQLLDCVADPDGEAGLAEMLGFESSGDEGFPDLHSYSANEVDVEEVEGEAMDRFEAWVKGSHEAQEKVRLLLLARLAEVVGEGHFAQIAEDWLESKARVRNHDDELA